MAKHCIWNCGRETKNKSRICGHCWEAAEILRVNSEAGYKAWLEHKLAKEVATLSEKQRAALDKARRAFLLGQLPASELLH